MAALNFLKTGLLAFAVFGASVYAQDATDSTVSAEFSSTTSIAESSFAVSQEFTSSGPVVSTTVASSVAQDSEPTTIGTAGTLGAALVTESEETLISDLPNINVNDLAHSVLKECPKLECYGRDCATVKDNGCKTCACPIGSPSRGCDRLPEKVWTDLMNNGCPNEEDPAAPRTTANRVIRWYRYVDSDKGIDECRFYMFPYCPDTDFNFWRSPRTHAECRYHCYRRGAELTIQPEIKLN